MAKFILCLMVLVVVYGIGYVVYLFVLWGKEIYKSRKFEKSEPTLEDRIEYFYQLSNKLHPKPKTKEEGELKKATPEPRHLTDFSKAENLTIAWEKKEGDQLKTTYFKQS